MVTRHIVFALVNALLLAVLAGCVGFEAERDALGQRRATLDAQVGRTFTNAALFKPDPTFSASGSLENTLAPIVLQERLGQSDTGLGVQNRFGALEVEGIDLERPAIYVRAGEVQIHGLAHAQMTYLWCYRPDPASGNPQVRGVRLTLNSAGEPVLWEPLSPEPSVRVFFVAESLERAAAAEHGAPLPGRRFAVERSAVETPDVFVARLIDDGPIPMGPMVYVEARANAISTVLCRCMPAQVGHIVENAFYELLPVESLPETPDFLDPDATAAARGLRALIVPESPSGGDRNEGQILRLPRTF